MNIVQIDHLPPSRLKDLFTAKRRHKYSFDIANASPRPGAAIVKETVHGPLYESSTSQAAMESRRQGELVLAVLMGRTEAEKQGSLAELAQAMDPLRVARESTSIYNDAEGFEGILLQREDVLGHHAVGPLFRSATCLALPRFLRRPLIAEALAEDHIGSQAARGWTGHNV